MRFLPFTKNKGGVQFAGLGYDSDSGGGGSYTLPPATTSTLGGVKVGSGLSVESDGTLSATGGGSGGGLTYSATEHVVGTWLDGSDVYEKTLTAEMQGGQSSVSLGVAGGVKYCEARGCLVTSTDIIQLFCSNATYTKYACSYIISNGSIRVYSEDTGTMYITVRYVKNS